MTEQTQQPTPDDQDKRAKEIKDTALIAMILNLVLPLVTGFIAVGVGDLIFSKYDEKFKNHGTIQLISSAGSMVLFLCLTFATFGFGIVISWVFLFVPISMFIWNIFDTVEIYQKYYS